MNYTKNIATFMIVLVVSLPIVFAQQLNVQKFSGRDNVNGFLREDDTLNVEVTAPGTLVPANLRFFSADTYFLFDNCVPVTGGLSKCTYSTTPAFYGTEQYIIRWHDPPASQTPREEKTITLVTDSLAPTVSTFTVDPLKSKEGRLQIQYVAEDRAFNPTDSATCSGLKEITFSLGNKRLFSEAGDKLCRKENSLTHDLTESGDLCARATDVIGRTSAPKCVHVIVDKIAPDIKTMTLSEPDGSLVTHAHTGEEKRANVVVVIEGNEDDVQFDSVIADLSRLNPSLTSKRADRRTGDNYVWENVGITTPASCGVSVTAVDALGNSATKSFSCTIGIDDTGPVANSLSTGFIEDGKQLLSGNGTITVEFEETGAGMNKSNAFLDLSQIGMGGRVKAEKCFKEGAVWKCLWNVRPTVSSTKQISVHIDTADDLGNRITQTGILRQDVLIDREPPVIESIEKIRIFHQALELANVTVIGDTTEFYLNASGFDTAFANFSDVSDAEQVMADSCEEKICKFSTVIQNSGPYLANLTFSFVDKAGNSAKRKVHLFVYGLSTETNPNYWKLRDVKCSPSLIDRQTASLISHPVYCALNLEKRNKNAVHVTSILPDPALCLGNVTGLINNVELKNSGFKSVHPTLAITLEATKFEVDALNISCPVEIYSKIGDLFTQVPETEVANFSIQFYNLPFGELSKNLDKRINDAVDSAEGTLKWVGTVQKFVDYVSKTCQLKGVITSILAALDSIIGVLTIAEAAADLIPGGQGVSQSIESLRKTTCGEVKGPLETLFMGNSGDTRNTLFTYLDKSCAFVDCRLTPEGEKFNDNALVNSGALFSGGGIPGTNWCQNLQNLLELKGVFGDLTTKDVTTQTKGISPQAKDDIEKPKKDPSEQLVSVKDSLIWSTACLCVPGMLYNLNKLRQIQCRYATCMLQDVKEKGIPTSYCSDLKHQQTCQFVMGEVFSILPFTAFLDTVSKKLSEALSNPFQLVATVMGCVCHGCELPLIGQVGGIAGEDLCKTPDGLPYLVCIGTKTISKIADATASIKSVEQMGKKDHWQTSNDWCEQMEKIVDRSEKQEE